MPGVSKTASLLALFVGVTMATDDSTASPPVGATTNSSTAHIKSIVCTPDTKNGIWSWYYNSWSDGPYSCTTKNDSREWCMFNAYRAGGAKDIHWKYTDDVNDKACLNNWKYYSEDGEKLLATIAGRTTTFNDSRRWCALPVYRSGGVYNKQWGECWCQQDRARQ